MPAKGTINQTESINIIEFTCEEGATEQLVHLSLVLENEGLITFGFYISCVGCLNNCSYPQGNCLSNKCYCEKGYYSTDCSTKLSLPDYVCQYQPFTIDVSVSESTATQS